MPRRSGTRYPALVAMVIAVVSCSPTVRLETLIVVPGSNLPDPEKLHVAGTKTCPAGPVATPDATLGKGDAEFHRVRTSASGLTIESAFRGGHCTLRVAFWYDANGNGVVDEGDAMGATEQVDAVDRGLCAGNLSRAPDVRLTSALP